MCTVTFIPSQHKVHITSIRDEKHRRSSASAPAIAEGETGKLMFPRDGDAGGTWIAVHENGNAIVFLNGGFAAHVFALHPTGIQTNVVRSRQSR